MSQTLEPLSAPGRFAPLDADHPAVGRECIGCRAALVVGDLVALVNGVPAGPDEQAKADEGRAHTLECQLAHESCAFPGGQRKDEP